MQPDPHPASFEDQAASKVPPPLAPASNLKSGSSRNLAILLSLCLGLFLVDAAVSLIDDSLSLFYGFHGFSIVRGLTSILASLMAIGVYVLMGLTPMVPKRLFLSISLFPLAGILAVFPFAIYCYGRLQQVAVGLSVCQVIIGLAILWWSQGGIKFSWPLVPENSSWAVAWLYAGEIFLYSCWRTSWS